MSQRYYLFFIISFLLFFCQCNKNSKILDLSQTDLTIDINRYENKFFALDTNKLIPSLHALRNEDSLFFDFYTIQMMRFGKITDTISPSILSIKEMLTNKAVLELRDTVANSFKNIEDIKIELTNAFKYFNYYFPNKSIPEVRTVISEFGYNAVSLDSTYLVLSLDMFLGKNYKYYRSFDFPNYVVKRFEKKYIVPNAMEVVYNQYFAKSQLESTDALIYTMIENGKKLYFLESMMPTKEREILIGYTVKQLEWCEASESEIWAFYNEHDLFYSKNYMEHKKHVSDGPKTAGMPESAPGNVGSWVGWQIVNQYMKNADGKVSLNQLLKTKPEIILTKSKYKPK